MALNRPNPLVSGAALAAVAFLAFQPTGTTAAGAGRHQAITRAEVVVTDRNGRPARGLKASAFTLLQNGEPQTLTDFRAVEIPVADRDIEDAASATAGQVVTNAPAVDGRAFMIMVDELHISTTPDGRRRVETLVTDLLRALTDQDDVAMVSIPDVGHGYDFSRDRAVQQYALERLRTDLRLESGRTDWNDDALATLEAIDGAVEAMTRTGRLRRVLVVITMSLDIQRRATDPRLRPVLAAVDRVNARARQTGVTLYTIDPRGPVGVATTAADTAYVDRLVSGTGGRVFYNQTDLRAVPRSIVAENGTFYVLEYQLAETETRRLGFGLSDDRLQARITFSPDRPVRRVTAANAGAALSEALNGPLDVPGVELRVSAVPVESPADQSGVRLDVDVVYPAGRRSGHDELIIRAVARDDEGAQVGAYEGTSPVELPDDVGQAVSRTWSGTLALPPGSATVRLGVYSPLLEALGTTRLVVSVPDGRAPLGPAGR